MLVTVESICESAARKLNIVMSGENLSGNDGAVVLEELNILLDTLNITPQATYTASPSSPFQPVVMTDSIEVPPGYLGPIILTLAEQISVPFGAQIPPKLAQSAREARAAVYAMNDVTPRYSAWDLGMPGGRRYPRGPYPVGWYWP